MLCKVDILKNKYIISISNIMKIVKFIKKFVDN